MAMTTPSAARLTPAGRGAIAVIRAEGAHADWNADGLFRAASGGAWCELPLDKPLFGCWGRDVAEDVVVCRLSLNSFEVQCHAGEAAVQRILADLQAQGFTTVDAAAQSGRGDELDGELQAALQHCHTWRAANLLLEQSNGVLRAAFKRLRNIAWTEAERSAAMNEIARLLDWSALGVHLSRPWSVVLTGRPNVGKSSLLNALLGFPRAIVAAVPGTTRDVVTVLTAFDGWPVELSDTAGLRKTHAELEAAGIALARDRLAAADCRLLLIDIGTPPHSEDFQLLSNWPEAIVVAHKADLPDCWNDRLPVGAIRVSSLAGQGIDLLITAIVRRLAPREPPPGTAVPVTPRQIQLLYDLQASLKHNDEPAYHRAANRLFDGRTETAGSC